MNVGVCQRVASGRMHLTEVQLQVEALHEAKHEAHKFYSVIRSVLAQCGVAGRDSEGLQRIVLSTLDATHGRVKREAQWEFGQIAKSFGDGAMMTAALYKEQSGPWNVLKNAYNESINGLSQFAASSSHSPRGKLVGNLAQVAPI